MKIVIDGNIGCGKTTQLNLLEDLGFRVKREPIEKWPLDLFYSDMERWGLTFQMIVLQTLTTEKGFVVYERSPMSSRDVFWETMKKTDLEDQVYRYIFDIEGWGPDVYILINKSPKLCFTHIRDRVQEGDSGVSLEYLQTLDEKYQKMYEKMDCPKYLIDGNKSVREVHQDIVKVVNEYHQMQLENVDG